MQTLTLHSVSRVILDPIIQAGSDNPFFYRYIEVQDEIGNMLQICLYSTTRAAIEINSLKEKQND